MTKSMEILVIDDEEKWLTFVKDALDKYEVDEARSMKLLVQRIALFVESGDKKPEEICFLEENGFLKESS